MAAHGSRKGSPVYQFFRCRGAAQEAVVTRTGSAAQKYSINKQYSSEAEAYLKSMVTKKRTAPATSAQ